MAYELVAARILAPQIGSTVYVWTSIIGVIIAALSLGYAYGGYIADRRVKSVDVVTMLMLGSAFVVLTLLAAPIILPFTSTAFSDPRIQGVFAAILLFAPASFLLGAISPYLARLKITRLDTTGSTIASLSALNAVGGIIGTFFTGFVFFAYIGSGHSLVLIALLLLVSSWFISPALQFRRRLGATLVIILIGLAAMNISPTSNRSVITTLDTPSARYEVVDVIMNERPIRALASGPTGLQSGVYKDGSDELAFLYTRKIAELIRLYPQPENILILGGGTFTLPQYLASEYPETTIDVVEIDDGLVSLAREYFGYKDPQNVTPIIDDARAFLNRNTTRYDIVVIDAYNDTTIPPTLATREYVERLQTAVKPNGVVLANVVGADSFRCRDLLRSLHGAYKSEFNYSEVYPLYDEFLLSVQNIIIAYASRETPWLPKSDITIPPMQPFTDDYAPVEFLKQKCDSST